MKFFSNLSLIVVVLAFCTVACNKSVTSDITSPPNKGDSIQYGKKVLLVLVDGIVGSELKSISPANLTNYSKNAMFSFDAINTYANDSVSRAYGWANILTGVMGDKHNVKNDEFTGANLAAYPSIISRLISSKPQINVAAVAANQNLVTNLLSDAHSKFAYENNDLEVLTKTTDIIRNGNSDFIITQFAGPDSAGSKGAFLASNSLYRSSVERMDSYIGQLVKTIQSRSNYQNENWLVVIASSKGSNSRYVPTGSTVWNAFDDKMHNTFLMFYNPRFVAKEFNRPVGLIPYMGNTPVYTVAGAAAQTTTGGSIPYSQMGSRMDFTGKEFTIQCKVKVPSGTNLYYPSFMGNRESFDAGKPGFLFFLEGAVWGMNCGGVGQGQLQAKGTAINDGTWHTLTGVARIENNTRTLYTFTDGANKTTGNVLPLDWNMASTQDFKVGWRPGATSGTAVANLSITDIRVYNTALSDAYIANNFCKTTISTDDPYKQNLITFLPNTTIYFLVNGGYLSPDFSGNNLHMNQISGGVTAISDQTARVCPPFTELTYRTLMNNVDISYQIYSWLGVSPASTWDLDGKTLIPNYIDVSN